MALKNDYQLTGKIICQGQLYINFNHMEKQAWVTLLLRKTTLSTVVECDRLCPSFPGKNSEKTWVLFHQLSAILSQNNLLDLQSRNIQL